MTTSDNPQTLQQTSEPSSAQKRLDRLVGTGKVSRETQGQVVYEWMEGVFFLSTKELSFAAGKSQETRD